MFKQATWFGLSLALHLAVTITLILLTSPDVKQTPEVVMVVLDNLAAAEIPLHKVYQTPVITATRPDAPDGSSEPAKPEVTRQLFESAGQQVPPITQAPEQDPAKELLKVSSKAPVAATSRPRVDDATPDLGPPAKMHVQHAAPAAAVQQSPEKVHQRYLKEHFTYIRDLITNQLVYPPMARKMNWSGKVVVAFVITEEGAVHSIRVIETSGFRILDKSAVETVRSVAPFPKPPQRAEIVVPINFRMAR